ncbi:LapA family protein [Pseudomonas extremorientalis]|uniref:Lipopolysaccharide assembly protein A domain-containing protein n=1 Tax=Pseudomonas extremorientalis TaxID=169669 RepID=A0A1H0W021_9PSED|nr:LapA family protein [Pseudomonas extremorientalis]KAB0518358.1 LapA family protein [Pseudomonas extremorientalis]OIN11859.1 hypothetical protein BFN10_07100 [Pseudomonas extremorientalis]SDP84060.1 Protein of unknown function [Pseudomonas extremorientalis]
MRGVKRVVVVLTVLVVALIVLAFVLENQQVASLSFFGFATGEMPVSVFVVVALIIGMLIGPLLSMWMPKPRRTPIPATRF